MKTTKHLPALIAALAWATLSTLPTAAAERLEHKALPAASGGTLTFKTVVGAIDIKTHDKDEVIYDAEVKPGSRWLGGSSGAIDKLEFAYESSGGDVKIFMKWKDDDRPRSVNLNARHTLLIPARYNLDVHTAGGKIEGSDINGKVAAHTSGGSIRFGKVNGEVKARTSGGSITLEDIKGDADVSTSGGGIKIGKVAGDVAANTSGGSITVGEVTGEMKGHTSGGSINAEVARQISESLELSTSGGSINLSVPDDFKADLNASTSGGRVECELPLQGTVKRNSVHGKVNGGGPKVTLSTSGGSIKVAKR
jgi:hypothetical protein